MLGGTPIAGPRPGARAAGQDGSAVLLAGLTPAQREAVGATDPLLCVLAGAGAGKTRVLTLRVAHRCAAGTADPEHVLVCTFSRKAASELRRRLWSLQVGSGVTAGTIHRTALSLLRQQRADRGQAPPDVMADRRALLAEVLAEPSAEAGAAPAGQVAERHRRVAARAARSGPHPPEVGALDTEIGWAKARLVGPGQYEEEAARHGRTSQLTPSRVAALYARAEELRRRRGVLDLDDLLVACAQMLEDDQAFAEAVRWRYRHLFVDEMQDVNPAQFQLLTQLLGDEPDLFVVGDPNQSVYGWNGADPGLLHRLPELFKGTRVIRLDENHRCSPQIVAVANAALGLTVRAAGQGAAAGSSDPAPAARAMLARRAAPVSTRPDGPVPVVVEHASDAEEAQWVAQQVWRAHRPGRRWSQLAVLARTNAQLVVVADALRAARIPITETGSDAGPTGDLRRVLSQSGRGLPRPGGSSGGLDSDDVDDEEDDDEIAEFGADDGADDGGDDGADDRGEDAMPGGDVDAGDFAGRGPVPPDARGRQPDGVVLATFHRAKGLQWPGVFVIGLSAGWVPHRSARTDAAVDEERRLLYVALTRAEEELWCSWARYADDTRAGSRRAARSPSPWLAPVTRTVERLAKAPPGPDRATVAARIAEMRAHLAADSPPLR